MLASIGFLDGGDEAPTRAHTDTHKRPQANTSPPHRQTRGTQFEGAGGPEHKLAQAQQDAGGYNDNDVITRKALGRADIVGAGKERRGNDILDQGASAARNNVGSNPPGPGGSQFKGEDYYRPESVPDSVSAEGYVPPESVTQASKETELGS